MKPVKCLISITKFLLCVVESFEDLMLITPDPRSYMVNGGILQEKGSKFLGNLAWVILKASISQDMSRSA